MNKKCRICSSDCSFGVLKKLTDDYCGSMISDMLTFLSGIQIELKENQPTKICASCLEKLVAANDLKKQVLDAERVLTELLMVAGSNENLELKPEPAPLYPIEQVIVEGSDISQTSEPALIRNQREKKNKKPNELDYKCHICSISFTKVGDKNLHVKSDHVNDSLCHICNKKCKTPTSLETHIKFHFKDYEWMCEICSKTFRYSNRLEIHMKLHHSKSSMFSCDLCGLTTKFKNNIKRHMEAVHMKLRVFNCTRCVGHKYSTQTGLSSHLLRIHGVTEPAASLNCDLGFSSLSDHKSHEEQAKTRLPAEPPNKIADLVCEACGESFATREKVRTHFYLKHKHSNKCDECNILFNNFPALTRHKKVKHQGHRPFRCDICEKTFGQKVSLVSHRNSHTKEKPFSCPHCPYRSGDYSSISKHKKRLHAEIQTSKA